MSVHSEFSKKTVHTIMGMKKNGEKITCLTAYDYTSAKILDDAGIDLILVGDSLGMVMNGCESTLPVTLDEIIYHTKAVRKGIKSCFLIADMPFGSYQCGEDEAVANCLRVVKETGANGIKLEGGKELSDIVRRVVDAGVNIMGHIGLKPQSINTLGGYKIQGKNGAAKLIEDAKALEEAGAFAILIEGVTSESAQAVTSELSVPTIGIGAGSGCDGQILVFHDVFGLFTDFCPKFVKRYAELAQTIKDAAREYIRDVKSGVFPGEENSFH